MDELALSGVAYVCLLFEFLRSQGHQTGLLLQKLLAKLDKDDAELLQAKALLQELMMAGQHSGFNAYIMFLVKQL